MEKENWEDIFLFFSQRKSFRVSGIWKLVCDKRNEKINIFQEGKQKFWKQRRVGGGK